ncbi:Protein of unknown function [Pyronema omphalodes CBS 100304]|uniref:Uncharacterized protein n=1 Tax=Pyronema omphalodes (strain CBS 100304) TaxID=1076935 RepID=U4L7H5_PYROM|nr:Protein of unknown function [Pyronema omphalodes CBS 100304]
MPAPQYSHYSRNIVQEPISIKFTGQSLTRIQFRIWSREEPNYYNRDDFERIRINPMITDTKSTGVDHLFRNPYLLRTTWFKTATLPYAAPSVLIQSNVNATGRGVNSRYYFVVWDITDSNPKIREWLSAVKHGDKIRIHEKAKRGWLNMTQDVEIIVYGV